MRSSRRLFSIAFTAIMLVGSGHAQAGRSSLRALVAEAEKQGVRVGVVVRDDGRSLFDYQAEQFFIPASNQKILTSAAAVLGLGDDYRFRTSFTVTDGVLVVKAGGDPNWVTGTKMAPDLLLAKLASELKSRGCEALRGVRLDLGSFSGASRPQGWPQDQLDRTYCPPTGGLVLDRGCFQIELSAGRGSEAGLRVLAPLAGYPVKGRITMSSRSSAHWIRLQGGAVRVSGRLNQKMKPQVLQATVHDAPSEVFEQVLRMVFAREGVGFAATAPARTLEPLVIQASIGSALERILRDSSNFDAEQLLRVLGANTQGDGSFEGGIKALEVQLHRLVGPLPDGFVAVDGSGLSRGSRVSPALLARTLERALDGSFGAMFLAALPRAGKDGTLRRRFLKAPVASRVRAKSGWIRGVSALSGVIDADRVFSILMNYDPDKQGLNARLKLIQERMVTAMATLGETPAP